jgi:hypothetical protein
MEARKTVQRRGSAHTNTTRTWLWALCVGHMALGALTQQRPTLAQLHTPLRMSRHVKIVYAHSKGPMKGAFLAQAHCCWWHLLWRRASCEAGLVSGSWWCTVGLLAAIARWWYTSPRPDSSALVWAWAQALHAQHQHQHAPSGRTVCRLLYVMDHTHAGLGGMTVYTGQQRPTQVKMDRGPASNIRPCHRWV